MNGISFSWGQPPTSAWCHEPPFPRFCFWNNNITRGKAPTSAWGKAFWIYDRNMNIQITRRGLIPIEYQLRVWRLLESREHVLHDICLVWEPGSFWFSILPLAFETKIFQIYQALPTLPQRPLVPCNQADYRMLIFAHPHTNHQIRAKWFWARTTMHRRQ